MKFFTKISLLIVALLCLFGCRVDYKTFKTSGYKGKYSHAEFIHDYWTCEKHNTRMHKAVMPVKYGIVCAIPQPPDSMPNARHTLCGGGNISKQPFVVKPVCAKCTAAFKRYKRAL